MSLTESFPWLSTLEKYSRIGYFNPDLLTFSSNAAHWQNLQKHHCMRTGLQLKQLLNQLVVTIQILNGRKMSYKKSPYWKKIYLPDKIGF